MLVRLMLGLVLLLSVTGCATMRGGSSSNSQLEARVDQLEKQAQYKDDEIKTLRYELQDLSSQVKGQPSSSTKSTVSSSSSSDLKKTDIIRVSVSPEKVQRALKGAGFYQGPIDGKIGAQTKNAIAAFQKEHNLNPDGVVGKKTWEALETYLK